MKRIVLLFLCYCFCSNLYAQSITDGRVKYADMLNTYEQYVEAHEDEDDEEAREDDPNEAREGIRFQFERWKWNWRNRVDDQGYLVPYAQSAAAWKDYLGSNGNYAAKTTSTPANWIFQGPDDCGFYSNSLGRINVIEFDPVDSNILYIGTPGGGVWKTTNGGNTWVCLFDQLISIGVSDIKVNPLNRNTIFVVTGDSDGFLSYSSGVIVSHDGGLTWNNTGYTISVPHVATRTSSILINPVDTNTLILGTSSGVYVSHNAGATWTVRDARVYKQLLYHPTDTSIVYGTIYSTWNAYSSDNAQIMRSVDGGATWNPVTTFTGAQRINIAVTPANPSIVRAVVSTTSQGLKGIYGSTDAGATFTPIVLDNAACTYNLMGWSATFPTSDCSGQAAYDQCIAISPVNPDEMVLGGVRTFFSGNGGVTWQAALPNTHSDKHFLGYHPLTGALFEGNDGGILKTYNAAFGPRVGLTNGLGITEFYYNAVDNNVSFCLGGTQDNGSMKLSGSTATFLTGGDGFMTLFNYGDPANVFYTSYQYGNVLITRDGGTTFRSITDTLHTTGDWVTPFVLHPSDTNRLFLAIKRVYASSNNGISWTAISPEFDAGNYVRTLAISGKNPNYLYATVSSYPRNKVYYTSNMGSTWNTIDFPYNYLSITDLVIDPENEKKFWVTIGGYNAIGPSLKVLGYDLTVGAWANETGTLPNYPVNCMIADTATGTRYIGAESAVFYKTKTMSDWALYNTNLPTTRVQDLNINYTTGEIWAATQGRGMWHSVKNDVPTGIDFPHLNAPLITLSPNPATREFTITTNSKSLMTASVEVRLLSAAGNCVMVVPGSFDYGGHLKIDASDLPPGFYICEVSGNNTITRTKVVVN